MADIDLGDDPLDHLERFLRTARVVGLMFMDDGGHHQDKQQIILEGGVMCLAKPSDAIPNGWWAVQCEAAAWQVARALGWPDLVPTTVIREDVPTRKSVKSRASVQVLVAEDFEAHVWSDEIDERDVFRCAVFDYLIAHSDRTHNWLLTSEAYGVPRVILIDNGLAFDVEGRSISSRFIAEVAGRPIPDDVLAPIRRFVAESPHTDLKEMLPHGGYEKMLLRAKLLLDEGLFAAEVALDRNV